jgi:hypothetical protein
LLPDHPKGNIDEDLFWQRWSEREQAIEVLHQHSRELQVDEEVARMEKVIRELRIIETDDGYRIEIKGDKERMKRFMRGFRGRKHRHGPFKFFGMPGPGFGFGGGPGYGPGGGPGFWAGFAPWGADFDRDHDR